MRATCTMEGCDRPLSSRREGLCNLHYQRWQRNGDPRGHLSSQDAPTRFWAKVDRGGNDQCWPWIAYRSVDGYGRFSPDSRKPVNAHRYAYELLVGPIPAGLQLDHLCRNRACVNPAHLEPVTPKENVARSPYQLSTINEAKTHCQRGHKFTPENTYVYPDGRRQCKTCRPALQKRWRDKQNV